MTYPQLISAKLFIPPPRSNAVIRPRLTERLSGGLNGKLSLVHGHAGSGKTTLVCEWLHGSGLAAAWLSLDEQDREPSRFILYLCAALRKAGVSLEPEFMRALQSGSYPAAEPVLTELLHKLEAETKPLVLVLDDYHLCAADATDSALQFLLEQLPQLLHIVLISRELPRFPLARLRASNALNEIGAAELSFSAAESALFLRESMGVTGLSKADAELLGKRTEGWIAALQLAAISLRRTENVSGFVASYTGSHGFIADYFLEEVLRRQPQHIQSFLLRTSILERMCGPLCAAVAAGASETLDAASGGALLSELELAQLFVVPLDGERRWYRYHHLFREMLLQRLPLHDERTAAELHLRASDWHEQNGFPAEAFRHAVSAGDIGRAARLAEGGGMPLQFRGGLDPVLGWLRKLPAAELELRPQLRVLYASALLMTGELSSVEPLLKAAESAFEGGEKEERALDWIGHIASIRAVLAVTRHDAAAILEQSQKALQLLRPDNVPVRTSAQWSLGYAYQLQGNQALAEKAYAEALSGSRKIGHTVIFMMSMLGLGQLQEADLRFYEASETYREVIGLAGKPPLPAACEAYLGLARIHAARGEPDLARPLAMQSLQLARQLEQTDRALAAEQLLVKLEQTGKRGVDRNVIAAATVPDSGANRFPLVEPLSERELEVLRLVAQGRSNREIADLLFIALATVKGHNRIIFDKLQVKRRTEAVARARALGLLQG
ncbi:LuxR C-terminal-related transcriptional regulator [Paenibacillus pasadenensis]|uniref:LuxR C-terminal-related transcriptional regulator n=1 Tax=Paenibacillus pasadenensis TaxID=217090 RepID=UPI00203CA38B|nr:LuxR C-terminal-related transcriptional regulator [Paenibacillus pasadenensis]MCM3747040.1 LuxR C-terminal-related transcriptional regulator [Paenibacillus pasadenensis]